MLKKAKFIVPRRINYFDPRPVAQPSGKTATQLCRLAKKSKLSITELYIIEKMGYVLEIKYEGKL